MVFVNRKSGAIPINSEYHCMIDDVHTESLVWPFDNGSLRGCLTDEGFISSFTISDAVFMILCGGLSIPWIGWVNSKGGASSFLRGLFINDTWSSLTNPVLEMVKNRRRLVPAGRSSVLHVLGCSIHTMD